MQGQKSIKLKLQLSVWKARVIFYITNLLGDGSSGWSSDQFFLQSWLESACSKSDRRMVLHICLWSVAKMWGFAKVIGICLCFSTEVSYCTWMTWILNSGELYCVPLWAERTHAAFQLIQNWNVSGTGLHHLLGSRFFIYTPDFSSTASLSAKQCLYF